MKLFSGSVNIPECTSVIVLIYDIGTSILNLE